MKQSLDSKSFLILYVTCSLYRKIKMNSSASKFYILTLKVGIIPHEKII